MATKAQIIEKIQNALSLNAGITDWDEVEGYLITDDDSILENVYKDADYDNETNETYFTSNPVDSEFQVSISKVGRNIHVSGTYTYTGVLPITSTTPTITINDVNLKCPEGFNFIGFGSIIIPRENKSTIVNNNAGDCKIRFTAELKQDESIEFFITYPSEI
jgi:hypothetical protein